LRYANPTFYEAIVCSLDETQWNPECITLSCIVPDYAALHPGYFALLLPFRGKAGMGVVLYA